MPIKIWVGYGALISFLCSMVYQVADPDGGTVQGFRPTIEGSMGPDFSGANEPTYPIVLFHLHKFPTPDELRDRARGPQVVCIVLNTLTFGNADVSAAPMTCRPSVDEGLGWVYTTVPDFGARAANGVVVVPSGCEPELRFPLRAGEPIHLAAPEWTPTVVFAQNGTVVVDDTWVLRPGQSLKADYWLVGHEWGTSDDRQIRVAIDYPGRWLESRVGAMPSDPITGETEGRDGVLPTETFGDIEARVPLVPQNLESLLSPLINASGSTILSSFGFAFFDGRLTDLSVTMGDNEASIEWYVGGRDADQVRMIGRRAPNRIAGINASTFAYAFDVSPLSTYVDALGGSVPVRVWWAPERGLQTQSIVPWSETWIEPPACDDCPYVWAPGPLGDETWRRHPGPMQSAEGALTFGVEAVTSDAVSRVFFHQPVGDQDSAAPVPGLGASTESLAPRTRVP